MKTLVLIAVVGLFVGFISPGNRIVIESSMSYTHPADTTISGVIVNIVHLEKTGKVMYYMKLPNSDSIIRTPSHNLRRADRKTVIDRISEKETKSELSVLLKRRTYTINSRYRATFMLSLFCDGSILSCRFIVPSEIIMTPDSCADLFNDMNEAHLFSPWEEDVESVTISVPLVVE